MWPLAVAAVVLGATVAAASFPPDVVRALTTSPTSHKARRLAKGSPLLVWVGSKDGPHFEARAELVRDPELAARMGEAYRRKYWIAWLGFFCPSAERLRAGKIVIVRIRPPA